MGQAGRDPNISISIGYMASTTPSSSGYQAVTIAFILPGIKKNKEPGELPELQKSEAILHIHQGPTRGAGWWTSIQASSGSVTYLQ